jgi:medium-chain acyl-[acyl-carrier-protein] hydrolase
MIRDLSRDTYVTRPRPNPQARVRLLCLPYAGGSAAIFRTWPANLPASVEVCPVELPGRGARIKEALVTGLVPIAAAITHHVAATLDRPFALFGHSMGAVLAFEIARALRAEYGFEPEHLFVSGRNAPHIPDPDPPIHELPRAEFIAKLRGLDGTPAGVLEHEQLMELMLPILRADFESSETYAYSAGHPLTCAITAFGGLTDREVSAAHLEAWREHTTGPFTARMFPGGHFFIHSAQTLLLGAIADKLDQMVGRG